MPARDEVAECDHAGVLGQHPERTDGQHVRTGEFTRHAHVIPLRDLACDHFPPTISVLHEPERTPPLSALPFEEFVRDDRLISFLSDLQVIGDQRSSRTFAVLQLDDDRALALAAAQFPEASAPIPGSPDAVGEALREEREDIEDRGLAASVGAEQHGERCQVGQGHIAQGAVVPNPDGGDTGRRHFRDTGCTRAFPSRSCGRESAPIRGASRWCACGRILLRTPRRVPCPLRGRRVPGRGPGRR